MFINELESIDINEISLKLLGSEEFVDYNNEHLITNPQDSDLKINSNLKTGISKDFDMALLRVDINVLDKPNKRAIYLEVDFFFSLNDTNEKKEVMFKNIPLEAIPYVSLELVNLVKNISSQDTSINAINLPYNFLQKSESHYL